MYEGGLQMLGTKRFIHFESEEVKTFRRIIPHTMEDGLHYFFLRSGQSYKSLMLSLKLSLKLPRFEIGQWSMHQEALKDARCVSVLCPVIGSTVGRGLFL